MREILNMPENSKLLKQKILLTGADGFIGRRLFQKLKELGCDVVGTDKKRAGGEDLTLADITDEKAVRGLFGGRAFDIVFHLAAFVPKLEREVSFKKYFSVNGLATLNLLRAASENKVKKFIYSSSISVYNRVDTPLPARESYSSPENIYGLSKLIGEELCEIFRRNHGLNAISLRYASVYGFGQEPYAVLPVFVKRASDNRPLEVFGGGQRTQDFVYVEDAVRANLAAAVSEEQGVFNIGSGRETTILDLAKTVIRVFNETKSVIVIKKETKETADRFVMDISKAKDKLGFSPGYLLEEGLRQYKKEIELNKSIKND